MAHKHKNSHECQFPLSEKCGECGAAICEEEYIVCWGWCDDCLSASLEAYEKERRKHASESQQ